MPRRLKLRSAARTPPRSGDASLLDIVDNVLQHGVVLDGDLVLGVANIDLIYARLSLVLSSIDRLAPQQERPAGKAARTKP